MNNNSTHFKNVSASYIDLMFALKINYLIIWIKQSVYDKFDHNIIYRKLKSDMHLPLYYRKIWDYKKVNTELIQRAISAFNWDMAFQNKDINDKTKVLNKIYWVNSMILFAI